MGRELRERELFLLDETELGIVRSQRAGWSKTCLISARCMFLLQSVWTNPSAGMAEHTITSFEIEHSLQGAIAVNVRQASMEKLRPTQPIATCPYWHSANAKEVWRRS